MSRIRSTIVLSLLVYLQQVTGFQVTFNPASPMIGSTATGNFTISCDINNDPSLSTNNEIISIVLSSRTEEKIAQLFIFNGELKTSHPGSQFQNRGGSVSAVYDEDRMGSTRLILTVPSNQLLCTDGIEYKCKLDYKVLNANDGSFTQLESEKSRNLTVTAMPSGPLRMTAYNNSNNGAMIDSGKQANNPAIFHTQQTLRLQCTSTGIGSSPFTEIRWKHVTSNGMMQDLNPGTESQNQSEPADMGNCQYSRQSSILYQITTNSQRVQCYLYSNQLGNGVYETPEEDRPKFYIQVYSEGGNVGPLDGNSEPSEAGAIAGGTIGGIVFIVIIVLLVYFVWYRRRGTGKDYTTKEEMGASNPNLAPTYAVPDKTRQRDDYDEEGERRPKPKPRPGRGGGNGSTTELHYAELDLTKDPPKAPRRKRHGDQGVEYAEVEFKQAHSSTQI